MVMFKIWISTNSHEQISFTGNFARKIACGCTKACKENWTCRELGINSSMFCKECMGINWENLRLIMRSEINNVSVSEINNEVYDEADDDIDLHFENTYSKFIVWIVEYALLYIMNVF